MEVAILIEAPSASGAYDVFMEDYNAVGVNDLQIGEFADTRGAVHYRPWVKCQDDGLGDMEVEYG